MERVPFEWLVNVNPRVLVTLNFTDFGFNGGRTVYPKRRIQGISVTTS